MQAFRKTALNRQRGISLTALILVIAVIGLFAVLVIKVVPSYIEYRAVKSGMMRAKEAGGTVAEMQQTFNKYAEVNNVEIVRGRDLVITRDSGTPQLSFAYEKRIPLTDRVVIAITYDGTTDPTGVVAASVE